MAGKISATALKKLDWIKDPPPELMMKFIGEDKFKKLITQAIDNRIKELTALRRAFK